MTPVPSIELSELRWQQMAAAAYNAYGDSVDHKNYAGLPMPEWNGLTDAIRAAWINACKQVAVEFNIRPTETAMQPEPKTTRAKFYLHHKTEYTSGVKGGGVGSVELEFMAVTDGSEENKKFWRYTPSGKLVIQIQPEAAALFETSKEYYLDFTPAE